jgi:hypothetical protein
MNDQLDVAIAALQTEIDQKEQEIILPLKQAANQLCKIMGKEPLYALSDDSGSSPKSKSPWRIDHFFNKGLSPSVNQILTWKKESGSDGPMTVDEIYEHLMAGGFKFEGTGTEENQKRALKIAMVKNTAQFAKIGENVFGLRTWYGMRAPRRKNGEAESEVDSESASEPAPPPVDATKQSETAK